MISQTAEYALRAVAFLTTCQGTPANRREIAKKTQVPLDYLTKVLQELDHAGIVTAQRGPGGGYTLLVPAEKLSVLEVVSAIAPIPRVVECPLGIADHADLCPLHQRMDEAARLVEEAFRATTIAELIQPAVDQEICQFPPVK